MKTKISIVLLLISILYVSCSEDSGTESPSEIQSIDITVSEITSSSVIITFPEVEKAHNYTLKLYDVDGEWVDVDSILDMEVVDGVATSDGFDDLNSDTEYKVVVEVTRNVLGEGIITLAQDSINFRTLVQ